MAENKTIHHGIGIRFKQVHNIAGIIGTVAHNPDIAAQYHRKTPPIALVSGGFGAVKAPKKPGAAFGCKRGVAIGIGSGKISTLRYPYLIAGLRCREGVL